MANNSLVMKAKKLKSVHFTKFNKFFYLLNSICKLHDAFNQQTRMLMRQNANSDVSKDTSKKQFSVFTWRHGSHVGAPTKSPVNLALLVCKRFLLFSLKNMAVDLVSENQQYKPATDHDPRPSGQEALVLFLTSLFPRALCATREKDWVCLPYLAACCTKQRSTLSWICLCWECWELKK